jgi:hypothetical protein
MRQSIFRTLIRLGVILEITQAVLLFNPGNYVPAFRWETAECERWAGFREEHSYWETGSTTRDKDSVQQMCVCSPQWITRCKKYEHELCQSELARNQCS